MVIYVGGKRNYVIVEGGGCAMKIHYVGQGPLGTLVNCFNLIMGCEIYCPHPSRV